MSERKRIYLCLAHMSEDGMEQKYVKSPLPKIGEGFREWLKPSLIRQERVG
jgi:hypothetical protein